MSTRHCFLPDGYLARKARRRANAVGGVLFLIVMLAIGSAFALSERTLRMVQIDHAAMQQNYAAAVAKVVQVQQLQETQRRMNRDAEAAASLVEKVPRSFLIAEVTNALPPGVSLTELKLESKVQSLQLGETIAATSRIATKSLDVKIHIAGVAESDVQVSQFVNKLSRSNALYEVNLVVSEDFMAKGDSTTADVRKRRFVIDTLLDATPAPPASRQMISTNAVELQPE